MTFFFFILQRVKIRGLTTFVIFVFKSRAFHITFLILRRMKLGTLFMLIKVLIKVIKKNLSMSVEFTVSPFCGEKPFYSKFVSVVTKMLTS